MKISNLAVALLAVATIAQAAEKEETKEQRDARTGWDLQPRRRQTLPVVLCISGRIRRIIPESKRQWTVPM